MSHIISQNYYFKSASSHLCQTKEYTLHFFTFLGNITKKSAFKSEKRDSFCIYRVDKRHKSLELEWTGCFGDVWYDGSRVLAFYYLPVDENCEKKV